MKDLSTQPLLGFGHAAKPAKLSQAEQRRQSERELEHRKVTRAVQPPHESFHWHGPCVFVHEGAKASPAQQARWRRALRTLGAREVPNVSAGATVFVVSDPSNLGLLQFVWWAGVRSRTRLISRTARHGIDAAEGLHLASLHFHLRKATDVACKQFPHLARTQTLST